MTMWDEFLRDPNGVLVRLGLHPATSPEINERTNRMFYATLTNKAFLRLVHDKIANYRPPRADVESWREYSLAGLRRGVVRHKPDEDEAVLDHIIADPGFMREAFVTLLKDFRRKSILSRRISTQDIESYAGELIDAIGQGTSIGRFPKLDEWDRNYGVGKAFASLFAEVGAFVTGVGVAELGLWVTALGPDDEEEPPVVAVATLMSQGMGEGDRGALVAAATLARLNDLAAELFVHADRFEGR